MNKSFIFVFIFNLLICYLCSSCYFSFDRITIQFARSLNDEFDLNFYTHSLRYINWTIPILIPIILLFIRSLRFNLHQCFIFNIIGLLFMKIVFYGLEFFFLSNNTNNLDSILNKLWALQLFNSSILSIMYWINFSSLISHFEKDEILLIESCYILTTFFGCLNYDLTFKSYYLLFGMSTILFLIVYYAFIKTGVNIKDDFKQLPILKLKDHLLNLPIVFSAFFESFCIGGLLFIYLLPVFGLFILSFIPIKNSQSLSIEFYSKLNQINYFPFLCGITFGIFFLSTFALLNIKKTVWSMLANNLLFIYIWSLMFDFKFPNHYFNGILNGLFFFAIAINILIQSRTIIDNLNANTIERSETISMLAPGILFLGILLNWLILAVCFFLKLYYYNTNLLEYQLYYLYSLFLIGLFLCSFHQIMQDDYVGKLPIRISRSTTI